MHSRFKLFSFGKRISYWSFLLFLTLFFSFIIPFLPPGIDSPSPVGPYLNGIFPSATPGTGTGDWEVELAYTRLTFIDPVALIQLPDQSGFYVAGKTGLIWQIPNNPQTSSKTTVLDIRSKVDTHGDSGLSNLILHPEFGNAGSPNRGYMYVVYRYHPDAPVSCSTGAFTRLSRFTKPDNSDFIDPDSEYILIQQYDQHCWHNGSGMFFGPDGFLYVTFGDAGGADDEYNTSQQIDRMLLGGLMRIDVNRNPATSHPVRRQPVDPGSKPSSLPSSFTQGYYIPNDNPWVNPNGSILEEFYSVGLRSPHRASYDPVTGTIWVGDVGQGAREEVTLIEKGANSQWPYREGSISGPKSKPSPLIGFDKPPIYDYSHSVGNSVIGGFVYRGAKYASSLNGKYIFGDHGVRNIWTLNPANGEVIFLVNIPGSGTGSKNGISSFATDANGNVYILKLYGTDQDGGLIYKLKQSSTVPDPPQFLSQVGAFSNLANLAPASGLVPYTVNTPLWSDGAEKYRWIALPNNGSHNTASEQITFSATSEWQFPEGTVFVKHFELPVDENNPSITKRVETRFLIRSEDGGVYGVTYKWNDEQTDAELLTTSDTKTFTVTRSDGSQDTQVWDFPSRTECISCHNANANFVLGVKTWQLNGNFTYPSGITDNQLNTWHHLDMFANPFNISQIPGFLKSIPLDNTSESLEVRVRSYLDANCSHCHRPNGVEGAFDARFSVPLASQNLVDAVAISSNAPPGAVIVKPGDPANSDLWVRDNSVNSGNSMPPLAKNLAHSEYISVLTAWINSLGDCPEEQGTPCDDGDPCTVNDVIQSNCTCAGTFQDTDNDGTCDAEDICNGGPEPGTPCDDGDSETFGETIQADCSCGGGSVGNLITTCSTISASSDDAEEKVSGAITLTSSDLELINDDLVDQTVGLRFTGLSIPPGATITNATIQFTVNESTQRDPCLLNIYGEKSENALTFTTGNGNISSRPKTSAFEQWSPPDWTPDGASGNDQKTVDLSRVIQEIVSQNGYTSSSAVVILITGTGTRVADSYNGSSATAPTLCVEYTEAAGYDCPVIQANIGEACDDGDPSTYNDSVDSECNCTGIPCPAAGTACNDGNPDTENDVEDGDCNCAGTPPACPPAGTPCDDGDLATENDVEDGNCNCAGECLPANTPCDDGNPDTENDVWDGDCNCAGTPPACPPAGTPCDDGDLATENDVEDGNCNCAGECLPANTPCDDDDAGTENDVWDGNCNCAGTPVCTTVGEPCDDLDICTVDDVFDADCNCAGVYQDNDGDGFCIGEDPDDNDFCVPDPGNAGCNPCNELSSDDFESGWGVWNSGGGNSSLDTRESTSGTTSLRLRGNSGVSSSTYTDNMNLNFYSTVEINFSFRTRSMKSNDNGFILEMSTNGGASYSLVKEWNYQIDFENDSWYQDQILISGVGLSTNTILRLVCNAPNNGSYLYIDDITITACTTALSRVAGDQRAGSTAKGEEISNEKVPDREPVNSLASGRLIIKASPNPFREELNIFIEKPFPELKQAVVRIMDENGRIIYQRFNVPFNEEVVVPLHAGWTSGVYFIRVQASEYVETVRVVKH